MRVGTIGMGIYRFSNISAVKMEAQKIGLTNLAPSCHEYMSESLTYYHFEYEAKKRPNSLEGKCISVYLVDNITQKP